MLTTFDADVDVKVGQLTARDVTAQGVRLAGRLKDGKLELRNTGVQDLAGDQRPKSDGGGRLFGG